MGKLILATGTPGVGKTTLARGLAKALGGSYVELGREIRKRSLFSGYDQASRSYVVDENRLRGFLRSTVRSSNITVIDSHFVPEGLPKTEQTICFVVRRHPEQLRRTLKRRRYTSRKVRENLQAEILDYSLIEALGNFPRRHVAELDSTGMTSQDVLRKALRVLQGRENPRIGVVDWISALDQTNKLIRFLEG